MAFKVINDGRLRADITRHSLCNVIFLFCQSKLKAFLTGDLKLSSKVKFELPEFWQRHDWKKLIMFEKLKFHISGVDHNSYSRFIRHLVCHHLCVTSVNMTKEVFIFV